MDEVAKQQKRESELMLAYQQNDQQAFRTLYELYADRVYGFILKKVTTKEVAEELYQIVFERIHHKRHLYRTETPVGAWIFTLTKNIIVDFYRREKVASHFLKMQERQQSETHHGEEEQLEVDINRLSQREKEVITMRYWQDLDFEEIAKSLKLSHNNVRKIISRSLAKLRGKKNE